MSFVAQIGTRRKPVITLNNLSSATAEQAETILNRFVIKRNGLPADSMVTQSVYERTLASTELNTPDLGKLLNALQTVATGSRPVDASERKLLDNAQQTLNAHYDMDRDSAIIAEALKSSLYGVIKPGRTLHQTARNEVAALSR